MDKNSGFTLIELVIVIVLTGILAVTAIPKLIGSSSFEGQAYRDQLLQLLKTVQQQAMSCDAECRAGRSSNPYACNKVVITNQRFGIPANCGSSLPASFAAPHLGMSIDEANNSQVSFAVTNTAESNVIEFNEWGIANGCDGNILGCDISIKGEQELFIRIESQGFSHEI